MFNIIYLTFKSKGISYIYTFLGKNKEKTSSCHLCVLYVLQSGDEVDVEEYYSDIKAIILQLIADKTLSNNQLSRVLLSLSTLCFLCTGKLGIIRVR